MLSAENILEIEKRRQIFNIILENPGLHLRELSRRTDNMTFGSLRYHIEILEKKGYIIINSDKRFTRFYATEKTCRRDKELLNVLRQEIPRKIVLLLLANGPAEIYKDNDSYYSLTWELSSFIHSKKDLVGLTKYWKKPFDEKFHLIKHRTTIDFHIKKLLDADIIEKIKVGKEMKYKIKEEFEIWNFLFNYKKSFSDKLVDDMLSWFIYSLTKKSDDILEAIYEIFPHPYHV